MSIKKYLREKGSGPYSSYPITFKAGNKMLKGKIVSAGIIRTINKRQVLVSIIAVSGSKAYATSRVVKYRKDHSFTNNKFESLCTKDLENSK